MKRSELEREMKELDEVISAQRKAKQFADGFNEITDTKNLKRMMARMGEINDNNIRQKMIELKEAIENNSSPAIIKNKNTELKKALDDAANVDISAQTKRQNELKQAYMQKTSEEMSDKVKNLFEGQEFAVNVSAGKGYPDIGFPPKANKASAFVVKREQGKVVVQNTTDKPIVINGKEIPAGQKVTVDGDATIKLHDGTEFKLDI